MITVLYNTPVNLKNCNLPDIPNFSDVSFVKAICMAWKVEVTTFFKAAKLPTSWLKIPKSVIVTSFPLSSFKYLMYLAELCCDSRDVFLIDGRSWSWSCHLCCGHGGCRWHFLAPFNFASFPMRIPVQSSVLIRETTPLQVCLFFFPWWDTLKVQTATSRHHIMHEFRECSVLLSCFPRMSRMF